MALTIAVEHAPTESVILVDNAGVLAAVRGSNPRVQYGSWVDFIRDQVQNKFLTLRHVRGHTGVLGNELADRYAKYATMLPDPPRVSPSSCWEVTQCGAVVGYPHKTWIRHLAPRHSQQGIHPLSWTPFLAGSNAWAYWLFGCIWSAGFMSPISFWFNRPSPHPCEFCHTHHNASIHGYIAFCSTHPVVRAWEKAWGSWSPITQQWKRTAVARDRFLLGKLTIPSSLWRCLVSQVGKRPARQAIRHFQFNILPLLQVLVPVRAPPTGTNVRPNCYRPDGWGQKPEPPAKRRRMRNRS